MGREKSRASVVAGRCGMNLKSAGTEDDAIGLKILWTKLWGASVVRL